MLKAFVPAYDIATYENARLARHLFPYSSNLIVGEDATQQALFDIFKLIHTKSVLLMGHGGVNRVYGQNDELAIGLDDVMLNKEGLLRLNVFAWACKTSNGIGTAFQQSANLHSLSGSWWGYNAAITAPNPKELSAFREIFTLIINRFPSAYNESTVSNFGSELKELCESHRLRLISSMAQGRTYRDSHEAAVAFREIWSCLVVRFPDFTYRHLEGEMLSPTIADI
ncbi:hypothetical protein G3436_26535 [Pseudomonas sp. MAFF212427]|jgi:hypothetical protein|uniref:CHAT domain-containing protein n=1 Tax=Pseudomonas brassicae TaxID=2708063 RepID=A0A6B3NU13_9PSED|nr:hypothetical protein [Pseudomonas brassicae]NER66752.1 hypothetical protein [Pseudomonas brassicae]